MKTERRFFTRPRLWGLLCVKLLQRRGDQGKERQRT